MSVDTIRSLLESEMQTRYPGLQPTVPVKFMNTRFDTPTVPWVHVAVIPNVDKRANIGSQAEFASWGIVNVSCLVPENSGTANVRKLADSVVSVLADRQISIPGGGHITTYGVSYRDRGVINGWYTVNVIVTYRARVLLVRA